MNMPLKLTVVNFDQQLNACACFCMVENDEKRFKIIKNILFSSCVWEAHVRPTFKNPHKPYMSLLYAWWWKKYVFDYFQAFFIVFDNANTCASMHLLVEIHNNWLLFCNLNMSLFLSIDFDFIKRIGSNVINQLDPEIDVIYKLNTVMLNLAFLASFSVFSTNKKMSIKREKTNFVIVVK